MRGPASRAAVAAAALSAAACHGLSDQEAVALVRAYDARVIEAYRTGDARLVEGAAGPEEARKLTGLIGVKLDMGVTLDAQLLELSVLRVERGGEAVAVLTDERWHYLDRRVGTGEQVGQDSTDRYRMRYRLERIGGRWVVAAIEFASPPEVGRTEVLNRSDVSSMHGVETRHPRPDGGAGPPSPEPLDGGRKGRP